MARFVTAPDEAKSGYEVDGKHAPRSVWRMRIRLQCRGSSRPPPNPHTLVIRDVRRAGWAPEGDVVEADSCSPVQYMTDVILKRADERKGNLKGIFMAHGLPGYVMCGKGGFDHPTSGPGLTVAGNLQFERLRGAVQRISFDSGRVARIGDCHARNGHKGCDGNPFCCIVAREDCPYRSSSRAVRND